MNKTNIFFTATLFVAVASVNAQQITGSSLFSPIAGGARILSAQGNTAASPAIGFQATVSTTLTAQNDGGGGNGIFRPASNTMAFSTSSLERMRISSGGFVGIGTTAPLAKLHVNDGMMMVTGNNNLGGPMVMIGGGGVSDPNGQWGIEYETADLGLNFWRPFPAVNSGNYFLFLANNGSIGMGVPPVNINSAYKLSVNGAIRATKVVVEIGWADYVFNKNYKLMPLSEVEKYITTNNHLPNIPSASEIENNGLDVGAVQSKQMEKIEELTLYIIEMNKKIQELTSKVSDLESNKEVE
jgi:hypothetical protein